MKARGVRLLTEARTDHDVKPRMQRFLAGLLGDGAEAEHVAGEILVVVAMDVMGVHRGGRGVVNGTLVTVPSFQPCVLERMEERRSEAFRRRER